MSEGLLHDATGRKGWSATTVFVCGKCSGNGKKMAKVLRREGRERLGRRAVRVVRTGCMGLCPKHAVSLVIVRAGHSQSFTTAPGAEPHEVAVALFSSQ